MKHISDKTIASPHYERRVINPVLELKKWISSYDKFTETRTTPDLFMRSSKTVSAYNIEKKPMDSELRIYPYRYILIEQKKGSEYIVKDFGDFHEKNKVDRALRYYKLNAKHVDTFATSIYNFIRIVNRWLDNTGGEFLIDNMKEFEIRHEGNSSWFK